MDNEVKIPEATEIAEVVKPSMLRKAGPYAVGAGLGVLIGIAGYKLVNKFIRKGEDARVAKAKSAEVVEEGSEEEEESEA